MLNKFMGAVESHGFEDGSSVLTELLMIKGGGTLGSV